MNLNIPQNVHLALTEDGCTQDINALLIAPDTQMRAEILTRVPGILCGCAWVDEVFHQLDPLITIQWHYQDGEAITTNSILCVLQGPARPLLTGERTALNFLQLLSGTATLTHQYRQRISDTGTELLDTRKTLPGLRHAQKYAVRCGGGKNHRLGLNDAFLIKENHIFACGSIANAISMAKQLKPNIPIEIEVESLDELNIALTHGADIVLLDNFSIDELTQAVNITEKRALLEASGNITLDNIHAVAKTGVDRIAVGALTKTISPLDLSMRFYP